MRLKVSATLDYYFPQACDLLVALEVAPLPDQRLVEDLLTVKGAGPLHPVEDAEGVGRRTWMPVQGRIEGDYRATVDVERSPVQLDGLAIAPLHEIPSAVLPYLWPSRYCEADKFESFVDKRFGEIEGGARIAAMADWIRDEMDYVPGTSDTNTTAGCSLTVRPNTNGPTR